MALGSKNRIIHDASVCRENLRMQHPGQLALVNEFINEVEGSEGDAAWSRFTDLKRNEREMLQRVEVAFQKWLNP